MTHTPRRPPPMAALLCGAGLFLAACSAPSVTPPTAPTAPPAARALAPPTWRPGDLWVYGWRGGTESATRTLEVLEIREINGVAYYLLRAGPLEHLWTRQLEWAGSLRDQKVEARMTPPAPLFAWPLEPGRRWDHRGVYEDRDGKKPVDDTFSVVGVEVVEVPAGRFNAFKVVRETNRRDSDQYWYAPEVGFYVKWIGRRGDFQFEEQLQEYRAAPRLIPDRSPSASPSQ